MASAYGKSINISIFGESHGDGIGVVIQGLPAGFPLDMDKLRAFLARRAPGQGDYATPRREADNPEFLSGLYRGRLTGTPLAAVIRNTNTRSEDYEKLSFVPRPGHADYTGEIRYRGAQDKRGGGHFSGRLTAPLCIAGGIALQLLEAEGIQIGAHIEQIGRERDVRFDPVRVAASDFPAGGFPVIDREAGERMLAAVRCARAQGDSLGGIIECAIVGVPAGLGDPMFGGVENEISAAVFGVPAVKGIEFGIGFAAAGLFGSENNDPYEKGTQGEIRTTTNNHGGILGGISSGMPIIFRAAIKPTPSISREQKSIDLVSGEETMLSIKGRHDPCIVPRAVPCIEAAAAVAMLNVYGCGRA